MKINYNKQDLFLNFKVLIIILFIA